MTDITLDLSESQVLALLHQVSPRARQILLRMLIDDLDVDWQEVDEWEGPEAFSRGVSFSVRDALDEGLTDGEDIEALVVQICYRAADFGFLLDRTGLRLSDYSQELRDSALPLDSPDHDDVTQS